MQNVTFSVQFHTATNRSEQLLIPHLSFILAGNAPHVFKWIGPGPTSSTLNHVPSHTAWYLSGYRDGRTAFPDILLSQCRQITNYHDTLILTKQIPVINLCSSYGSHWSQQRMLCQQPYKCWTLHFKTEETDFHLLITHFPISPSPESIHRRTYIHSYKQRRRPMYVRVCVCEAAFRFWIRAIPVTNLAPCPSCRDRNTPVQSEMPLSRVPFRHFVLLFSSPIGMVRALRFILVTMPVCCTQLFFSEFRYINPFGLFGYWWVIIRKQLSSVGCCWRQVLKTLEKVH